MKKNLIRALFCAAMVTSGLAGCSGNRSATGTTAQEAVEKTSASSEAGRVYYLNFKREIRWECVFCI